MTARLVVPGDSFDDLSGVRQVGHGSIIVHLGWRGLGHKFEVWGGPYDSFPGGDWVGVCLREQVPRDKKATFHLPIQDFSVPENPAQVKAVLTDIVTEAMRGRRVYVGCMGGMGRTGIVLALLARLSRWTDKYNLDAVQVVREAYHPKAVETKTQYRYVMSFDLSQVRREILAEAIEMRLGRRFRWLAKLLPTRR